MLYGPNTNGGNSIILMLEFQVEYMLRMVDEVEAAGSDWLDVCQDIMDDYNTGLQKELESVAVWQVGASDDYRTEAGKIASPSGRIASRSKRSASHADRLSSYEVGRAQA